MKKLIRDKIPEIAEKEGRTLNISQAELYELESYFKQKLLEETNEVLSAKNPKELIEELADLSQVLEDMLEIQGIRSQVFRVKYAKFEERGGFTNGILLEKE